MKKKMMKKISKKSQNNAVKKTVKPISFRSRAGFGGAAPRPGKGG